jgi:signal transduction histidine kinase
MISLNRRVIFAVVGVTSLVVMIAALGIWLATRSLLMREIDRELTSRVERLKRYDWLGSPDFWNSNNNSTDARRRFERIITSSGDGRLFIQVIHAADDHELFRSATLSPGLDLAPLSTQTHPRDILVHHYLADGSAVRFIAFHMAHNPARNDSSNWRREGGPRPEGPSTNDKTSRGPPPPPPRQAVVIAAPEKSSAAMPDSNVAGVMIFVGLGLEQVDGELSRMASVLGALWAAATLLALASILLLRPAVLRPINELAAAIARLGPDDLAVRVPTALAPHEMRVVADCLNRLLDRLEQAFMREQATIANIAHELRTPVAELRTALEFRRLSANADEHPELDGLLGTVARMQNQVTNLLLLARLEAGKESLQRSDADLGDLAAEAIERWEERASAAGLRITAEPFVPAPMTTSPDHLGLVLDNLLGNAVAHGASGDIRVTVSAEATLVRITFTNLFAGKINPLLLGQAYYRGDQARHGADHSGLGLALCQRLCRLLDAQLELDGNAGFFRASVVLKRRA